MDDLISRQAAIETADFECGEWRGLAGTIINGLKNLPAVDAVPVVRCRDCKYSYIFEPWEGKNAVRYCNQLRHAYAKDSDLPVREEGFCSMGERREEDAVD